MFTSKYVVAIICVEKINKVTKYYGEDIRRSME